MALPRLHIAGLIDFGRIIRREMNPGVRIAMESAAFGALALLRRSVMRLGDCRPGPTHSPQRPAKETSAPAESTPASGPPSNFRLLIGNPLARLRLLDR